MKLTTYLRAICKIPAVRVFARRLLKVGSYVVKWEHRLGQTGANPWRSSWKAPGRGQYSNSLFNSPPNMNCGGDRTLDLSVFLA